MNDLQLRTIELLEKLGNSPLSYLESELDELKYQLKNLNEEEYSNKLENDILFKEDMEANIINKALALGAEKYEIRMIETFVWFPNSAGFCIN